MADIEKINKRFEAAKLRAIQWRSTWSEAYKYANPNDNTIYEVNSVGAKKNVDVYDTNAVHAMQIGVSQLISGLTPPSMRFAEIVAPANIADNVSQEFKEQLQNTTDIVYKYLNPSNFGMVIEKAYKDLYISTGAILVHELPGDENPFTFTHVPLSSLYPEEGPNGTINTAFRELVDIPARTVLEMWPDANIPSEWTSNLDQKVTLVEGTIFNVGAPKSKQYTYLVYWETNNHVLVEFKTESSPWVIFRWSTNALEVFGRGPVINALPTIRTADAMKKNFITTSSYKAQPMFFGDERSGYNEWTIDFTPGAIIPARFIDGKPPLVPLEMGGEPQFAMEMYQQMVKEILDLMFASPVTLPSEPVRTATEIAIRQRSIMETRGPAISRLQVEFLNPLFNRIIYILSKKGLIPKFEIDNKVATLQLKTPLQQSQNITDLLNFQQYWEAYSNTVGPQVALGTLNIPEVAIWMAEKTNIPISLIKSKTDMENTIQKVLESITQQVQPQTAQQIGGQQLPPSVQQSLLQQEGVV